MSAPTKVQLIGGHFQDAMGNVLAEGSLTMELVQDEQLSSSTGQVCGGIKITIPLDEEGNVFGTSGDESEPNQYVWPTDVMTPSGASYTVWGYTAEGELAWGPNYNLLVPSGSTFDVDNWIPNSTGGNSGGNTGGVTFQVEGVNTEVQTLVNFESTDSSVTITDEGNGSIDFQASGGGGPAASVPFVTPPISLSQNSNVTGQNGNNVLNLYFLNLPYEKTFSNIAWWSASGDNGTDLSDIGIYSVASVSATTGTLVAHIGPTTGITNSSVNDLPIVEGTVTLPAGLYLFATLSNHGAGFSIGYAIPSELGYGWSTTATGSAGTLPATITIVPKGLVWMASQGITNFTSGFPAIGLI
jgi:hypothetical protein